MFRELIHFQGRQLSKLFLSCSEIWSVLKGKNFAPHRSFRVDPFSGGKGSKFFPFGVDPFSEET